jgi:hypothetical protein
MKRFLNFLVHWGFVSNNKENRDLTPVSIGFQQYTTDSTEEFLNKLHKTTKILLKDSHVREASKI